MTDRRIWIIFLIVFVNLLGFGIILPLLPYYIESLGAGVLVVGLLSATYSLFQLISAPILGELSDKIGRRPILIFSLLGTTVSFFLLGWAKTLPLLFLSRIIDGASGGNISTAQAYVADITKKENRTQGMGILMAAFSLGFILGPALGGVLSRYGYAVPAYVAGVVSLIATILTYFYLPETVKIKPAAGLIKPKKKYFSFKDFYDVFTHPQVGNVVIVSFLMMVAFSIMQGTFAWFSEHNLGLGAEQNGYLFAYLGFVGIVVQIFLLKKITKAMSDYRLIVISLVMMSVSFVLLAESYDLRLLLLALTGLAFANSILGPVLAGLVSKLTPDHEQGNIMGVSQSVGSIARLIGPILGVVLYERLGAQSPFFFGSLILMLTALGSTLWLKPVTFRAKLIDWLRGRFK